jgi:hypothetical protein
MWKVHSCNENSGSNSRAKILERERCQVSRYSSLASGTGAERRREDRRNSKRSSETKLCHSSSLVTCHFQQERGAWIRWSGHIIEMEIFKFF